jgi:hypothetical protein
MKTVSKVASSAINKAALQALILEPVALVKSQVKESTSYERHQSR